MIKKINLYLTLIILLFCKINLQATIQNNIIAKVDNEIISTIDLENELKIELNIKTLAQTEELIFSCPHKNPSVKKRLGEDFHKICSAWRKYVAENT